MAGDKNFLPRPEEVPQEAWDAAPDEEKRAFLEGREAIQPVPYPPEKLLDAAIEIPATIGANVINAAKTGQPLDPKYLERAVDPLSYGPGIFTELKPAITGKPATKTDVAAEFLTRVLTPGLGKTGIPKPQAIKQGVEKGLQGLSKALEEGGIAGALAHLGMTPSRFRRIRKDGGLAEIRETGREALTSGAIKAGEKISNTLDRAEDVQLNQVWPVIDNILEESANKGIDPNLVGEKLHEVARNAPDPVVARMLRRKADIFIGKYGNKPSKGPHVDVVEHPIGSTPNVEVDVARTPVNKSYGSYVNPETGAQHLAENLAPGTEEQLRIFSQGETPVMGKQLRIFHEPPPPPKKTMTPRELHGEKVANAEQVSWTDKTAVGKQKGLRQQGAVLKQELENAIGREDFNAANKSYQRLSEIIGSARSTEARKGLMQALGIGGTIGTGLNILYGGDNKKVGTGLTAAGILALLAKGRIAPTIAAASYGLSKKIPRNAPSLLNDNLSAYERILQGGKHGLYGASRPSLYKGMTEEDQ